MALYAEPWMEPAPLPHFSGEEDFHEFASQARRVLTRGPRLPDGVAAEWVIASLTSVARLEVTTRPPEETDTPDRVLDILDSVFGDQRDLCSLLAAFHGRRQGLGEGVLDFSQSLRTLGAKITMKAPTMVTPELLRDRFADGLHPAALRREVRRVVRERPATTFEAARTEALRWVREDAQAEPRLEPVPSSSVTINESIDELVELRKQVASLSRETEKLQAELQKTSAWTSRQTVSRRGKLRCWACGGADHLNAACRSRQPYHQRHLGDLCRAGWLKNEEAVTRLLPYYMSGTDSKLDEHLGTRPVTTAVAKAATVLDKPEAEIPTPELSNKVVTGPLVSDQCPTPPIPTTPVPPVHQLWPDRVALKPPDPLSAESLAPLAPPGHWQRRSERRRKRPRWQ